MNECIIRCVDLGKTFAEGELTVEVLNRVNLSIHVGQQLAILGASGSGKSTLLHLLGGLDDPSAGIVQVAGEDLARLPEKERSRLRNESLGFVYQFHHLLPEFSTQENVAMPLLIRRGDPEQAMDTAADLLKKVGLAERMRHKPGEMSGGERQRAAVARALVTRPRCVLADEPTGNLDQKTAATVFDLMLELNQELGTSLVVVTHDLQLASIMSQRAQLQDGGLAFIA